jgi:hypothetical protein
VRRFLCSWAPCVAAIAAIGAASAQSLPPGVEDCLAAIQQRSTDAGAARPSSVEAPRLGDVCPELAAAIDQGTWGEALAGTSADDLSTTAFRTLTELVAAYQRPGASDLELRSDALDESLAALKLGEPTAELTLWERIQRWFDEQFGSRSGDARGWLESWLEHLSLSERVVRYLVVVLGIALVVATVVVVVNELRVAGVLAGGVLRKYSPLSASAPEEEPHAVDFDDIARAPLARRPVLLLALVLERLRARNNAPLRDSLTHRELLGAAAGLNAEQSVAFATVVGAAERVTFGEWRPEERDVEGVVARGRALLSSFASDEGPTR